MVRKPGVNSHGTHCGGRVLCVAFDAILRSLNLPDLSPRNRGFHRHKEFLELVGVKPRSTRNAPVCPQVPDVASHATISSLSFGWNY